MALHSLYKVAGRVDFLHQLLDHHLAVLADVVGVGFHNLPAVLVIPFQGHHLAGLVVVDCDFRVHPQGEHTGRDAALLGLGAAAGEKGRQNSQGRRRR